MAEERKSPIGQPGDLRICWKIANGKGHGDWFPPDAISRNALQSHIDHGNQEYGRGTHWLETKKP